MSLARLLARLQGAYSPYSDSVPQPPGVKWWRAGELNQLLELRRSKPSLYVVLKLVQQWVFLYLNSLVSVAVGEF